MTSWGMVSDKVIVVSADGILKFSKFLQLTQRSLCRFFSPSRLLQQKTMITVENDIVAGDVLLWLRGNFYHSFGSIRNGRHLFFFFFVAPAAIRAGSKMGCVELCDFNFCCASIFCQPMKKFEFSGATRATRQRHSKMSSTGDEDALNLSSIKIRRPQLPTMLSSSRFVRMLTR